MPSPTRGRGAPDYFPRAVDQGIGRALWFIHGAPARRVAAAVARFAGAPAGRPVERRRARRHVRRRLRADGPGRAARARPASTAAELAQGAVFAAKARDYAGYVPAHSDAAPRRWPACRRRRRGARRRRGRANDAGRRRPAYELWRARIRDHVPTVAKPAVVDRRSRTLSSRPSAR